MKKAAVVVMALLVVVAVAGCFGPRNVTRTVDDWLNQQYVDQPWLVGNVISHFIINIVMGICWFVDDIIDIYWFWVKDAWPFGSGKGTHFTHKAVTPAPGK